MAIGILETVKACLAVTLFASTSLVSLLPLLLRRLAIEAHPVERRHRRMLAFSLISCFGGGVFLATCLLDLLPDTNEAFQKAKKQFGPKTLRWHNFPLAEFMVAIGFFLILLMEQLSLWWKEHYLATTAATAAVATTDSSSDGESHRNLIVRANSDSGHLHHIRDRAQRQHSLEQPLLVDEASTESVDDTTSATRSAPVSRRGSVDESVRIHFDKLEHSTTRVYVLLGALSVHSCLEGVALGVVANSNQLYQVFAALCIHKSIIGFSLGMRLVQCLSTRTIVLCCLLFSATVAVGASLGILLIDEVRFTAGLFVQGCLQGVACGTFLYVTCFEILPHELNPPEHRLFKLLMVLAGFTVISLFVGSYPS